ncbi:MAG TPA: zinc ribbon domain-containing protein [Pyrinomonadaceae bacterium]|nr:zinc ribbon domain-containing protein [Pyrinomonadaceae bacterium]
MATCASCGTNNVDGTKFCVSCGATLAPAPAPESWRVSGDLNNQPPAADPYNPAGGYTPQPPPPNYPAYNAGQNMTPGYQQTPSANQPMHPVVPALVSFFFPGLGLLFVPNKAGLGIGIFAGTIAYAIVATILTFVVVGICLFIAMPIINIVAAIHSWDEAAKNSNGQFQPIYFK